MLPVIRIKFGHFLEPIFDAYAKAQYKDDNWQTQSRDEVVLKTEQYKNSWQPFEKKVLNGLTKILELDFYQNTIDVSIVSGYKGGFSLPMVISSRNEPDLFVDIITHELVHRLITDNTRMIDFAAISASIFPKITDRLVLNHVFVHAVHKEIYLNILCEPVRLERDITRCERFPAYKEAWRVVNEVGHEKIITDFKVLY